MCDIRLFIKDIMFCLMSECIRTYAICLMFFFGVYLCPACWKPPSFLSGSIKLIYYSRMKHNSSFVYLLRLCLCQWCDEGTLPYCDNSYLHVQQCHYKLCVKEMVSLLWSAVLLSIFTPKASGTFCSGFRGNVM